MTGCDESFVFEIPSPRVCRFIALLGALLFLCVAAYAPLKFGIARTYRGFEEHPALWCIVAMLLSEFALLLRLGFPPRRSLAKLHVRQNYVRITPGPIESLFGEPVIETAVTAQSKEILLCCSYSQGVPDGFRVIICAAGGSERQIRASSMDYLTARESQKLAAGMTIATGLPVRLVIRRSLPNGSSREEPWVPEAAEEKLKTVAALTGVALPLVGGIIVGHFLLRLAMTVTIGVFLWLGQILAFSALSHGHRAPTPIRALNLLTTLFAFSATYSFSALLMRFMSGSH